MKLMEIGCLKMFETLIYMCESSLNLGIGLIQEISWKKSEIEHYVKAVFTEYDS